MNAVKGSPRDLMAGWVPGARAVLEEGVLRGDEAIELDGHDNVIAIADWLCGCRRRWVTT